MLVDLSPLHLWNNALIFALGSQGCPKEIEQES